MLLLAANPVLAAGRVQEFLPKAQPAEFFPGADRFGPPQGDPPLIPAYQGARLLGYVYLNSDFTNSTGYSGKPINLLVGIDPNGVITGIKLVDHKEPIVLVGIPERRIVDAVNTLVGKDMKPVSTGAERPPQVDIVSGATVTVLVMGDSVVRSAVRLIRSGRLGTGGPAAGTAAPAAPAIVKRLDLSKSEIRDWQTLVGDGSLRRRPREQGAGLGGPAQRLAADDAAAGADGLVERLERLEDRLLLGLGERVPPGEVVGLCHQDQESHEAPPEWSTVGRTSTARSVRASSVTSLISSSRSEVSMT